MKPKFSIAGGRRRRLTYGEKVYMLQNDVAMEYILYGDTDSNVGIPEDAQATRRIDPMKYSLPFCSEPCYGRSEVGVRYMYNNTTDAGSSKDSNMGPGHSSHDDTARGHRSIYEAFRSISKQPPMQERAKSFILTPAADCCNSSSTSKSLQKKSVTFIEDTVQIENNLLPTIGSLKAEKGTKWNDVRPEQRTEDVSIEDGVSLLSEEGAFYDTGNTKQMNGTTLIVPKGVLKSEKMYDGCFKDEDTNFTHVAASGVIKDGWVHKENVEIQLPSADANSYGHGQTETEDLKLRCASDQGLLLESSRTSRLSEASSRMNLMKSDTAFKATKRCSYLPIKQSSASIENKSDTPSPDLQPFLKMSKRCCEEGCQSGSKEPMSKPEKSKGNTSSGHLSSHTRLSIVTPKDQAAKIKAGYIHPENQGSHLPGDKQGRKCQIARTASQGTSSQSCAINHEPSSDTVSIQIGKRSQYKNRNACLKSNKPTALVRKENNAGSSTRRSKESGGKVTSHRKVNMYIYLPMRCFTEPDLVTVVSVTANDINIKSTK